MMATQAEAHREWHHNAGVPMGTPGCPQDACHPPDDYEPPTVKCGNKPAHGGEPGYHYSAAEVRRCYQQRYQSQSQPQAASEPVLDRSSEAARRMHALKVTEPAMTFEQWAESHEWFDGELSRGEMMGAYQVYLAKLPSITVEQAVETMRSSNEAEAKQQAAQRRYATWATIPVGSDDYANYALRDGEHVRFYRVERPSTGKYAGKTYVKRYVSDDAVKVSWAEQGKALDAIVADPQAAAILYGRETQRCAICHRKLTDDKNKGPDGLTSRERGIGPVCIRKVSE